MINSNINNYKKIRDRLTLRDFEEASDNEEVREDSEEDLSELTS